MDFLAFLKLLKNSTLDNFFIYQFIGKEYPYIFFEQLYKFIKNKNLRVILSLDSELMTENELKMKLDMSFLSKGVIYWLKNFHNIPTLAKESLLNYFKYYKGPNSIIFFDNNRTESATNDNYLKIILPDKLEKQEYEEIYNFFYSLFPINSFFTNKVYEFLKPSLQKACILMSYQSLLGRNCELFFNNWFEKIVDSDTSLFNLSKLFFECNCKDFFNQWIKCRDDYSEEFWIVFWSEQLWQAFFFIKKANREGVLAAKKLGLKLPFSFINKTWQFYNTEFIKNAYNYLYKIDYLSKNGVGKYGLELWFYKFLTKEFFD